MVSKNIHCVGDGRGLRKIFVNGKEVNRCVYAHEVKRKARVHIADKNGCARIHKYKKKCLEKTLYGRVRVEFIEKTA